MISLTPAEKRLRDYLAALAAKADPDNPEASVVTYGAVAAELDPGDLGWVRSAPRYVTLKTALYHVATYEEEHGRPMVTGFVVRASRRGGRPAGQPGSGYYLLARRFDHLDDDSYQAEYEFWQEEMRACARFWRAAGAEVTDSGTVTLSDAQYNAIMGELAKIKQMLRQIRHG
jgi:hypothetical protein